MTAPLTALLLAALAQAPEGTRFSTESQSARYDASGEIATLTGDALVRSERLSVRADEIVYDQRQGTARARGNVLLVSGQLAGVADELEVDLNGDEVRARGGLFMQKTGISEPELQAVRTPQGLKEAGVTTLTVSGERLERLGPNRFLVDGLSFTPCDCKPTSPSWHIEASRADVEPGERAVLTWPVVYVYKLPVFISPWLYLPLSDRRTGLLVPRPGFAGISGTSLDAPVFITLGESADLTLTPGYSLGGREPAVGVKGPRLGLELRYVPSEQSSGRLTFTPLYDLQPWRDPANQALLDPTRQRGLRWSGAWSHATDFSRGFFTRAELAAFSDAALPRDLTTDVLQREADFVRSTAVAGRRGEDSYLGLDVSVRQDLGVAQQGGWGYALFGPGAPATLQRLPALTLALPEHPLLGPLHGSLRAELARIAPVGGVGAPADFYRQVGSPVATAVEGRTRLDVNPRLSLGLTLGQALRLVPYAAYRQDVWLTEGSGAWLHRGYPVFGALAETELSRVFPRGEQAWRHAIVPSIELRAVPFVLGNGPTALRGPAAPPPATFPYDEVDGAVPLGGFAQGSGQLSQRLSRKGPGGVVEVARLDVGQLFELWDPRATAPGGVLASAFARLGVYFGPLSVAATASYDWRAHTLEALTASVALQSARGDGLRASYTRLGQGGSERARRALDVLVGAPAEVTSLQPGQQATVDGNLVLPYGLSLGLSAVLVPSARDLARTFAQQRLALGFAPACNCWSVQASGGLAFLDDPVDPTRPLPVPVFGLTVDLGRFGTFGAGG